MHPTTADLWYGKTIGQAGLSTSVDRFTSCDGGRETGTHFRFSSLKYIGEDRENTL